MIEEEKEEIGIRVKERRTITTRHLDIAWKQHLTKADLNAK